MGNLLYDKQKDNAIEQWEQCVEKDADFAMAWRNLGWAHWLYTKNYPESAKCYRKAIELAPDQALFLEEIDQVYEAMGEDVQVRFDLLKSHHQTSLKRYHPLAAEVSTGTFVGEYDYVIDLLRTCYFPTREGVATFHDTYVDALILGGREKLAEGETKEAIDLYEEAFEYPVNHQVFLVDERTPRDAQIWWEIAQAYEAAGQRSKAMENYRKAAAVNDKGTDYRYWKGLCLEKTGKKGEAKALFEALVETGKAGIVTQYVNFYGAEGTTGSTVEGINSVAYYTMGLGYLGLGEKAKAKECFEKTVELKRDHLWANTMLKSL
jgi:tetratricopeptide (TPR) repeat protein